MTLARIIGLDLDELQELVGQQYFREHRLRGASLRAISRRIGKSLRTVATLSKKAQATGPLLDESHRLGWQRQVVLAASKTSLDLAAVRNLTTGIEEGDLELELEAMVDSGLLERDEYGHVRTAVRHVSFARDDVEARLESLRHFLSAVGHVLYRRFIRFENDAEAFARVLSFPVAPERLRALREAYYSDLRDAVASADAEAEATDPPGSVLFVAVSAPQDRAFTPTR